MDIRTSTEAFRRLKASYDLLLKARKDAETAAESFNRFAHISQTGAMVGLSGLDDAIASQKRTMQGFIEYAIAVDWISGTAYRELISLLAPVEEVFGIYDKNVAARLAARIGEVFAPLAGDILERTD